MNRHNWDEEPTNKFEHIVAARVLVAEDDDALRSMVANRLRQDGCEVIEARSGDEALDVIAAIEDGFSTVPALDLVILDMRMPGLTGLEVVQLLRSWCWTTPVLLVTAYPAPDVLEEAVEYGVSVIAKPFGLSRLSHAASEALRRRPS